MIALKMMMVSKLNLNQDHIGKVSSPDARAARDSSLNRLAIEAFIPMNLTRDQLT